MQRFTAVRLGQHALGIGITKFSYLLIAFLLAAFPVAASHADDKAVEKKPPAVGEKAPSFLLKDLKGKTLSLADQIKDGPTVIVVLRGYPGYQCPICTKQFGELLGKAKQFADAKASMLFIYPGPSTDLDKYAKEFIGKKTFPENYRFVVDPDFEFTELYHLRWNERGETAYPSSFVVDDKGVVRFVKISHSHGNRTSSSELLDALKKLGGRRS